jgi:SepF-like predicted cell division protein (DUF552 family)
MLSRHIAGFQNVKSGDSGPKWVEMPSVSGTSSGNIDAGENYHDLGIQYPDAPIPRTQSDVIVRRAVLDDISGTGDLMNWVSDGDIVIVEMSDLLSRDMELQLAVSNIQEFVEGDICGQVVRLGSSRLLLLPSTFDSARIQ